MTENETPHNGTNPGDAPGAAGQQHPTEPLPRMHFRPVPPPPGQPVQPGQQTQPGHAPYGPTDVFGRPTAHGNPPAQGYPHQPGYSHQQGSPFSQQPNPRAPGQPHPEQPGQAHGSDYPGGQDRRVTPHEPVRRTWPAIVGTAAVTALLVAGGTAVGTFALLNSDSPQVGSSISGLGQKSQISVTSVDDANWESVASDAAPSVVAIEVRTERGEGEGSGVVLDSEGHILTNDHVVSGARNDAVQVTLSDGRLFEARIVGLDPSTDLAVIKLVEPPSDLAPASFADSNNVIVGNAVMAVGNPLGLANTVTTGIVSAVARPVSTASEVDASDVVVTNAIQIDAAINPGNSGGPLFNTSGEIIGITSSIASLSQISGGQAGSIGLGFAIPANLASSVGDQLIGKGSAEHAFLGVSLSNATATADGVTRRGAKVESVTPDSPAADAGVRTGDVVVAFNGQPVSGAESLTGWVRELVSGDKATVTLARGGAAQDLEVTLVGKTDNAQSEPSRPDQGSDSDDPSNMPEDFFDWFLNQR